MGRENSTTDKRRGKHLIKADRIAMEIMLNKRHGIKEIAEFPGRHRRTKLNKRYSKLFEVQRARQGRLNSGRSLNPSPLIMVVSFLMSKAWSARLSAKKSVLNCIMRIPIRLGSADPMRMLIGLSDGLLPRDEILAPSALHLFKPFKTGSTITRANV